MESPSTPITPTRQSLRRQSIRSTGGGGHLPPSPRPESSYANLFTNKVNVKVNGVKRPRHSSTSSPLDKSLSSLSLSNPSPSPPFSTSSTSPPPSPRWRGRLRPLHHHSPAETILLDEDPPPTTPTALLPRKRKKKDFQEELLVQYKSEVAGSRGTISIYTSDVRSLSPGEWINDRIIDFWLSFAHSNGGIHPQDCDKIVIFSSLFYPALQLQLRQRRLNRSGLRGQGKGQEETPRSKRTGFSWTKGIQDLFLKEFIFLPIPLEGHWFLAVICYAGMVVDTLDKEMNNDEPEVGQDEQPEVGEGQDDIRILLQLLKNRRIRRNRVTPPTPPPTPMILIFDSFQSYEINHKSIAKALRQFLDMEWERRYPLTPLQFTESNLNLHVLDVPQQRNWTDCGCFLLSFFERFFLTPLPRRPPFPPSLKKDWSQPEEEVGGKRKQIYDQILQLIQDNEEEEKEVYIPLINFPKVKDKVKVKPPVSESESDSDQDVEMEDSEEKDKDLVFPKVKEQVKVKPVSERDSDSDQDVEMEDGDKVLMEAAGNEKSRKRRGQVLDDADLEKAILRAWDDSDVSDDDDDYVPLVPKKKGKSQNEVIGI